MQTHGSRFLGMVALAVVATGCVTVEERFTDTVSAEGVFTFQGTTDNGRIIYDGGAIDETFTVRGRTWGNGGGRAAAERRQQANDFFVEVRADTLVAAAQSFEGRSGVDFDVVGPRRMNVDIFTGSGQAQIFDAEGLHVATADSIFGRGIVGDVDFFADRGGIDVEVFPYVDGLVFIESRNGDVDLFLPFGLDYDLTVLGDPDHELVIDDLGFDTLVLEPGLVIGRRGSRSVLVDIVVVGGDVRILQSF
jgi:hypothetical protein